MRASARGRLTTGQYAWLGVAFLGAALVVYRPALEGPFVSDDHHYVAGNPYVHELSLANLVAMFDPTGAATVAVVNYTPVHLLLHSLAWQVFEREVLGHHLVNLALHVLASMLLIPLFLRTGLPRVAAVLGAGAFLLHPANVEAVAWISQLKSSSALVLSLGALLAYPRRPGVGSALFALALLAKPTAAFALPVAGLLDWTLGGRVRWRWLVVWAALFAAYAVAEFAAHQRAGAAQALLYETPWVLVRTVAALALRYLVMAATSLGVSAFHEPEPVGRMLDPWWLGAVGVLGLLGWRLVAVLRGRRPESLYWVWALVSYAPVSQVFPFLYPMADRYLYFILPGLIGGALLWARDAGERLPAPARRPAGRAASVLGVALLVAFAVHAERRAAIWRSPGTLLADAARHYPDGVSAQLLRARRAAQAGDAPAAVTALRAASERGYNRFQQLLTDPMLAPIRSDPAFQALVREIAGRWVESMRGREHPTQGELRMQAYAHVVRGERAEAERALRRALAMGGPLDAQIRSDLSDLGLAGAR